MRRGTGRVPSAGHPRRRQSYFVRSQTPGLKSMSKTGRYFVHPLVPSTVANGAFLLGHTPTVSHPQAIYRFWTMAMTTEDAASWFSALCAPKRAHSRSFRDANGNRPPKRDYKTVARCSKGLSHPLWTVLQHPAVLCIQPPPDSGVKQQ